MPRKQIEVLQCDRCSNSGKAYTVVFDGEGSKEFILCEKHNGPLEKLREVPYGVWKNPRKPRKRGIQKVKLEEIPRKE